MKFFEKFPLVWHQLIDCQQDDQVLLQNLSRRVMIIQKIKDIEGLLLPYNIYDGETPRSFAERVYGSFELFWIPCMINSIMDINNDWPKPEQRIVEELIAQYGLDGMDDSQIIANYGLTGISYHDDAINKNQAKRAIQVLDPDYVSMFVSQLEQELSK